jgi:hypothetical protein
MRLFCQCNAMHRRDVVCGGGAAVFSAIIATLIGSSKPVKAEAITGSVPELDSVAVRVVVDSYQFAVAPSKRAHASASDIDVSRASARAIAALHATIAFGGVRLAIDGGAKMAR